MSRDDEKNLSYGVHSARVIDVRDPEGRGRVKVRLPGSPDAPGEPFEAWARLATLMAGPRSGSWFVPDVDNEVLVAFEAGDPRRPFVLGALWAGDTPEEMDPAGHNYRKGFRSRNGIRFTLDDQDGNETLTMETPGGQKITLRDGVGSIEIADRQGNSIRLEPSGLTLTSSAKVTVNASSAEVSAGMLTVNAGMSKFSGVVQADTIIANSVVAASYTPGAGNLQ